MRVTTPEGVDLELTVAGMGSRMIAAAIDVTLQILIALGLVVLASLVLPDGGLEVAAYAIIGFVMAFGYDIAFEVLAAGRTPGKRWTGLRVLRASGAPVTLLPSAIRNILRIVDLAPALYAIGIVAIFLSRHNQRVGDMVAGTYVTRERQGGLRAAESRTGWVPAAASSRQLPAGFDASAVTPEEVATVRRYLERRDDLDADAADRLSRDLAERLRPKVAGVPSHASADELLELVAAAKTRAA